MFLHKKMSIILWTAISLLFIFGCDQKPENTFITQEEKPIQVNVYTVKKETYPIWAYFSGKTQAVDEVMIISRVTGELQESLFKPGDVVKKDQILFRIDKSEYQAVWDQKKAILEKDKASLNLANANVKRYAPLVEERLAPREKLDELIAVQKQLEAMIRADKAAIAAAELNLMYCDVKASISGQIGIPLVLNGNIVHKGTELSKIVQTEYLYVNFNPSAHDVVLIKKYKSEEKPKVKVFSRSSEHISIKLDGEIDFIDNVSNPSTGTVAMRAKIFNDKRLLVPGRFVQIKLFITDQIPILAVHPDQISQNQQGQFVYVVNLENKIEIRQVKQAYSNNDLIIISEGLVEGDRVIVGTINTLVNGMEVLPTEVPNPVKD